MSEVLLQTAALTRGFASGSRRIEVLRGLDLQVHEREAVAITTSPACLASWMPIELRLAKPQSA